MSMARKDAFIKWYLTERSKSSLTSGSKPTIDQLRQNALKFGYEIRTVMVDGAEVVKIRWSERSQFDFIDDFIANHRAKLRSNYLDLERRLSLCGVSAEKKHDDNVRQSEEYLTLRRELEKAREEKCRVEKLFADFVSHLCATHNIDWSILEQFRVELSKKWKSEFYGKGKNRT